jgi:hypothetical protein
MPDPAAIALAALAVSLLALILSLWLILRLRRVGQRTRPGPATDGLELMADAERIEALATQFSLLVDRLAAAEATGRGAVQRVGIVRFNPFEDTGSNQSFVLAMLDAEANGFVLSSLHSRQQTRIYLKPITAGKSDTALSEEETEAIKRAAG